MATVVDVLEQEWARLSDEAQASVEARRATKLDVHYGYHEPKKTNCLAALP